MGKELSDREIMELYRKDKCKGNEAIIDKYSSYIHKAICKQCPTWLREKNDLYQAGCEGIMYNIVSVMETHCFQIVENFTVMCVNFLGIFSQLFLICIAAE